MNRSSDEPIIVISAGVWATFLDALRAERTHSELCVIPTPDGGAALQHGTLVLTYTAAEWDAFLAGVHDHEFDREPAIL